MGKPDLRRYTGAVEVTLRSVRHESAKIVLVLFVVGLVSCKGLMEPAWPVATTVPSLGQPVAVGTGWSQTREATATKYPVQTPSPEPTLTPPKCVGLFLKMQDKYSNSPEAFTYTTSVNGKPSMQRIYQFGVGEPITVTTVLLVSGEGEFTLFPWNLDDVFSMTLVNSLGQTRERRMGGGSDRASWPQLVDHDHPRFRDLQINDLDVLPAGNYTLTLTYSILILDERYTVTGNPVLFQIKQP